MYLELASSETTHQAAAAMPPNLDMLHNACVLVTGAASGIGRDFVCAMATAHPHAKFSLLDLNEHGCQETLRLAERAAARPIEAIVVGCDVCSTEQQELAFSRHLARFTTLDVAFINAGVMERGDVLTSTTHDYLSTLHINLTAVVVGCNLAIRAMAPNPHGGVLLLTASAGGIFPMPQGPVYAAAKAGVIHLARSLAPRCSAKHIAVHALCPQYADTPLVRESMAKSALMRRAVEGDTAGRLLSVADVSRAALWLLQRPLEESPTTLFLAGSNGKWYRLEDRAPLHSVGGAATPRRPSLEGPAGASWRVWGSTPLPAIYQRVELHTLSTDFAAATRLVSVPCSPPGRGQLLIRRAYAGVNASDINFSAGRYFKGKGQQLPSPAGFEAVGVVAAVGDGVTGWAAGDAAATLVYGGYAEYATVDARQVLPVDAPTPEVVALLVSGLTASIALEVCGGKLGPGSTVMVTAAAGGTGQFAVQLAKRTGATVVATCSSEAKATMLRALGADRVINYRTEDVGAVLKDEFPKGLDCVYESVGGLLFQACVNALAVGGRCIVIGMMEEYSGEWKPSVHPGLAEKLLWKSASVTGFFLLNHARLFRKHLDRLQTLLRNKELRVQVDGRRFVGLASVPEAVEYLHSGRSSGKVVVQVANGALPDAPRGRL